MKDEMESILSIMADLNEFAPADDALGRLVSETDADELPLDELEQVAAARAQTSYADFLRKLEERHSGQ